MSSGPEFVGHTVLLSVVGPVPFSLNVESVSSHPGDGVVSGSLGDFSLFTVALDGSKLSTEFSSTSVSSFSPSLSGREELVVKVSFAEGFRVGVGLGVLLSLTHESLLGVTRRVTKLNVFLFV